MKTRDKIKNDLSKASDILLVCNQKAMVLKVCNESAWEEGHFPGIEEQDIGTVYIGMSQILSEIIDQVSDAQNLIGCCESSIDALCKPVKEVTA
ncbi:MAG: hypothetical protein WCJ37_14020 [Syntrophus sp. (in: bacteria)]